MSSPGVTVAAPSRLHFGLISLGKKGNYGGVGVMIDRPGWRLHLSPAERFAAEGAAAERAAQFAKRWCESLGRPAPPPCHLKVLAEAPQHAGLGSGTQLALSVASGLDALFGHASADAAEMARRVGRGRRSAIGAHGFAMGGAIADRGKTSSDRLAALDWRCDVPEAWRFLLMRPLGQQGIHGPPEERAFSQLSGADLNERRLRELAALIEASLQGQDFPLFSRVVYEFGRLAGLGFASQQGGAYAGQQLSRRVNLVRSLGVEGVGQSSWGPTLFAATPNQQQAEKLLLALEGEPSDQRWEYLIAAPNNRGAVISTSY